MLLGRGRLVILRILLLRRAAIHLRLRLLRRGRAVLLLAGRSVERRRARVLLWRRHVRRAVRPCVVARAALDDLLRLLRCTIGLRRGLLLRRAELLGHVVCDNASVRVELDADTGACRTLLVHWLLGNRDGALTSIRA